MVTNISVNSGTCARFHQYETLICVGVVLPRASPLDVRHLQQCVDVAVVDRLSGVLHLIHVSWQWLGFQVESSRVKASRKIISPACCGRLGGGLHELFL